MSASSQHSSIALSRPTQQDDTGLVITGVCPSGYAHAPPSKKPRGSWIWQHGERFIRDSDLSLVWLRTICHGDSVHHPSKDYIIPAVSTTLAQRHMERHGFDLKGRPVHRGQKRRAASMLDGESIAEEVLRVIHDYNIGDKVQYFMADNATANDRAIKVLSGSLDIRPEYHRLHCWAHVVNLVAKAVLYGTDIDALEPGEREESLSDSRHVAAFEALVRSVPSEEALMTWRREGSVAKLHNLVTHIQKMPKRRRFFEMKQNVNPDSDDDRIYRVIVNGGIRCNSSCDMIERAIKLRDAIELYQTHFRSLSDCDRLSASDCLDAGDWSELERLLEVLVPLERASLLLQEDNDMRHALWEQLATFDSLLGEFEKLKERYKYEPSSHIKSCVNLGWKKLDKYYGLSDITFAYRMAIFLHPHLKMAWFERHWGCRPARIDAAKDAIDNAYQLAKARWPLDSQKAVCLRPAEPTLKSESEFDEYNTLPQEVDLMDDLQLYKREERTLGLYSPSPLEWWLQNHLRFPLLRHLAFEFFAIPANPATMVFISADRLSRSFFDYVGRMRSKVLLRKIFVDECHLAVTAHSWRPKVAELSELRGIGVPLVMLTATMPLYMESDLESTMGSTVSTSWIRASTARKTTKYTVNDSIADGKLMEGAIRRCKDLTAQLKRRERMVTYRRSKADHMVELMKWE
ncbi:hypothetical protein MBLNU13_g10838t1 [Cladosporium sp. NU13]